MEKQIEEMRELIHKEIKKAVDIGLITWTEFAQYLTERLTEQGYCKQSDGEWIKKYDKAPRYVCSVCNHLFNNKEYKFCPSCGAKMKGAKDGKAD